MSTSIIVMNSLECLKWNLLKKFKFALSLAVLYLIIQRYLFSFAFPSLQTLGEDLVTVLDYLHVKYVIGLGEGAGWVLLWEYTRFRNNIIKCDITSIIYRANVLARFGLKHPSRCLGLILINCTGSAATVLEVNNILLQILFITFRLKLIL